MRPELINASVLAYLGDSIFVVEVPLPKLVTCEKKTVGVCP